MKHKMERVGGSLLLALIVVSGTVYVKPVKAVDNNLSFSGTLVSEPCDIDDNTSDINVDFGTVVKKYLYLNTRTESQPFIINLINCDTSLSNQATITFKGTESTELPGLMTVTGATGIAIGLEQQDGSPLKFNMPSSAITLADGTNTFTFKGYVEGEPDAIKNETITTGAFTATATFEIAYE